jgi:hypothetical protein
LSQLEDEISSLAATKPAAADKTKPAQAGDTFMPMSLPPPADAPAQAPPAPTILPPSARPQAKPIMDSYSEQPGSAPVIGRPHGHGPNDVDEDPAMGGTFNATSEQAHEESVSELKRNRNKTLLNHSGKPLDETEEPAADRPAARVADLKPLTLPPSPPPEAKPAEAEVQLASPAIEPPPPSAEAPSETVDVDTARAAVEAAFNSQPFNPSHNPLDSAGSLPVPDSPAAAPTGSSDANQPPQFQIPKP